MERRGYRFTLDGVSRVSRGVALCPIYLGSREHSQKVGRRYKIGSRVRVYDSPRDTEMTILEPTLRWPSVGMLWFFRTAGKSPVAL